MPIEIHEILEKELVTAVFQPIVSLATAEIIGYESFTRGPSNSPFHPFPNLFNEAKKHNLQFRLESLGHRNCLRGFSRLNLPGKIFLNFTPECLIQSDFSDSNLEGYIKEFDFVPDQVIIELTESHPGCEKNIFLEAVNHYHSRNFNIAMDDLGEGFSTLRLWLDLRPEFVKIDKFFIHNIAIDELKREFIQSMVQIAKKAGTKIIAEGIENQADLLTTQKLGIDYGQGYLLGLPSEIPVEMISEDIAAVILNDKTVGHSELNGKFPPGFQQSLVACDLVKKMDFVPPDMISEEVYQIFMHKLDLHSLPIIDKDNIPVGIINRQSMIDRFARPYRRELYGKKPCVLLLDPQPLIVEGKTTVQELSKLVVNAGRRILIDGFIVTENGRYVGMGEGSDLLQKITEMQIAAARYANPLTQLPGNVPIQQEVTKLFRQQVRFACVYIDLDHFKPFNDHYGFEQGDHVIILMGNVLSAIINPDLDFLGHIGGDDFICLFQSEDWEIKCRQALKEFDKEAAKLFLPEDIRNKGYFTEDRQGNMVRHPLLSVSMGAIEVGPGCFSSYHELAEASAGTKKMAKKIQGSSLYIDQRRYGNEINQNACPALVSTVGV